MLTSFGKKAGIISGTSHSVLLEVPCGRTPRYEITHLMEKLSFAGFAASQCEGDVNATKAQQLPELSAVKNENSLYVVFVSFVVEPTFLICTIQSCSSDHVAITLRQRRSLVRSRDLVNRGGLTDSCAFRRRCRNFRWVTPYSVVLGISWLLSKEQGLKVQVSVVYCI